jgi:hypothetical protein
MGIASTRSRRKTGDWEKPILKFTWEQDDSRHLQLSRQPPTIPIEITDSETDLPTKLTDISFSTSYKLVLGVQMAFDGNQCTQTTTFHEKCNKMAIPLLLCPLSHDETIQGYRSIFHPRLKYGLSVTNISNHNIS